MVGLASTKRPHIYLSCCGTQVVGLQHGNNSHCQQIASAEASLACVLTTMTALRTEVEACTEASRHKDLQQWGPEGSQQRQPDTPDAVVPLAASPRTPSCSVSAAETALLLDVSSKQVRLPCQPGLVAPCSTLAASRLLLLVTRPLSVTLTIVTR